MDLIPFTNGGRHVITDAQLDQVLSEITGVFYRGLYVGAQARVA